MKIYITDLMAFVGISLGIWGDSMVGIGEIQYDKIICAITGIACLSLSVYIRINKRWKK